MRELTAWVIDRTIAQLSEWRDQGLTLPVSINLAASDFSRPDFAEELEQKLRNASLDPALLGLECLETEKMLESPAALNGLDMLKNAGLKFLWMTLVRDTATLIICDKSRWTPSSLTALL